MGYLFLELLLFLLVAFLLGLLVGYWIWAGRGNKSLMLEQDLATAQKALADCQSARQRLEREDSATRTKLTDAQSRIASLEEALEKAKQDAFDAAAATPEPSPAPQADPAPMGIISGISQPDEEAKAKLSASPFLDKPVGVPDDLMLIKGVGPKLAALLDSLGVYHFFQIAGWSDDDVAKVDAEMTNFKGRIVRDNWIDQAKLLSAGDTETFVSRYGQLGENRK
ncbi:MAG: hypothetical protein AAF221_07175 [Pseudomonadota bacterium]